MISRHPWGESSTSFDQLDPIQQPLFEDSNLRVIRLTFPGGRGIQGYEIAVYRAQENWWYWQKITPDQARHLLAALKSEDALD